MIVVNDIVSGKLFRDALAVGAVGPGAASSLVIGTWGSYQRESNDWQKTTTQQEAGGSGLKGRRPPMRKSPKGSVVNKRKRL